MELKKPETKCCKNPDVKNEGYTKVGNKVVWEYYCYSCHKSFTEKG